MSVQYDFLFMGVNARTGASSTDLQDPYNWQYFDPEQGEFRDVMEPDIHGGWNQVGPFPPSGSVNGRGKQATGNLSSTLFAEGWLIAGSISTAIATDTLVGGASGAATLTASEFHGAHASSGGSISVSGTAYDVWAESGGKISANEIEAAGVVSGGSITAATVRGGISLAGASSTLEATDLSDSLALSDGAQATVRNIIGGTTGVTVTSEDSTLTITDYDTQTAVGLKSQFAATNSIIEIENDIALGRRTGDDSQFSIDGGAFTFAGPLSVGGFGRAKLDIIGGATATLGNVTIEAETIGDIRSRAYGHIEIAGPGTQVDADTITIGDKWRGSLTLRDGGALDVSGDIVIGQESTGVGQLFVGANESKKGATVSLHDLMVGRDGLAAVEIVDGASVAAGLVAIGAHVPTTVNYTGQNFGIGFDGDTLLVSQAGSRLDASSLKVADESASGKGSVRVAQGGLIQAGNLIVGGQGADGGTAPFAAGYVQVDGTNSRLQANHAQLGGGVPDRAVQDNGRGGHWSYLGGAGEIIIQSGGSVSIDKELILAATGTGSFSDPVSVSVLGGSLEIGGHAGAAADQLLIAAGGSLTGHGVVSANTILNEGTIVPKEGWLVLYGDLQGQGTVTIEENATLALAGASDATILFAGGYTSTLSLLDLSEFSGVLQDFQQGDTLFLPTVSSSPSPILATYAKGKLSLSTVGEITIKGDDPVPTFGLKPDALVGTDIETVKLRTLLDLSFDTYNATFVGADGYKVLMAAQPDNGFEAVAYIDQNANDTEPSIVIAFRGTQTATQSDLIKNLFADAAFPGAQPNALLRRYVSDATAFVMSVNNIVQAQYPHAQVMITGHSLGGALAQIVGEATDFGTAAFNAPGTGEVYAKLGAELAPLSSHQLGYGGTNINYRVAGDLVSLAGTQLGQTYTLRSPFVSNEPALDQLTTYALPNHLKSAFNFMSDPGAYFLGISESALAASLISLMQFGLRADYEISSTIRFAVQVGANQSFAFDPAGGTSFLFTAGAGSPSFASITLPVELGVATYQVRYRSGGTWSNFQSLEPGAAASVPLASDAIQFDPVDENGQPVVVPAGFLFTAKFAEAGQFTGELSVNGAQPEAHPFTALRTVAARGTAPSVAMHILDPVDPAYPDEGSLAVGIRSLPSNGTVLHSDGATPVTLSDVLTVTELALLKFQPTPDAFGSQANFVYSVTDPSFATSTGSVSLLVISAASIFPDFNGDGMLDVLFAGPNGAGLNFDYEWRMDDREITQQGAVEVYDPSPHPDFLQVVGDFNGDGSSDIMLEVPNASTNGIYEWRLSGAVNSGAIASRGSVDVADASLDLLGTADFNGDGISDLLWRSHTTGQVFEWQMKNQAQITSSNTQLAISPLDLNWKVAGAGDFDGDGKSDLLLRCGGASNAAQGLVNGAFHIWEMNGNAIVREGNLAGPSTADWKMLGIGDFNGDGMFDIAIQKAATDASGPVGAVWIYLMDGTASHLANGTTVIGGAGVGRVGGTPAEVAAQHLAGIGELNGDGMDDILFRNDAGFFYAWNMGTDGSGNPKILSEGGTDSQGHLLWADPSLHVVTQHWEIV